MLVFEVGRHFGDNKKYGFDDFFNVFKPLSEMR
jgi:hypothetical protein